MAAMMQLDDKDAAVSWPIYREYESELSKLFSFDFRVTKYTTANRRMRFLQQHPPSDAQRIAREF
jgi:hypothetical protein